jgi:putative ABC transport system ATP-binding protein
MFAINRHKTVAVRHVSLQAFAGELTVVLGPSGSGKTTLLTLMAGLIKPTSGNVWLMGRKIEEFSAGELDRLRARRIGFVFQNFLLIDALTAIENVALVLRLGGKRRADARMKARLLLRQCGIEGLAEKFPSALSQGEKQRVAVARAIANNAELLIADEPTASLDTKQGLEVIRLLQGYAKNRQGCVIVASHDLRVVDFADHVVRLEDGVVQMIRQGGVKKDTAPGSVHEGGYLSATGRTQTEVADDRPRRS